MNRLIRVTTVLSICVAGIFTPGVLRAPGVLQGPVLPRVAHAEPVAAPTITTSTPPRMRVYAKPSDDDRLMMEALAPLIVAQQRTEHGHCGEFYDEAMAVGWLPSEWRRLRFIIARETGNTCDPGVLNDSDETRDLSYGLTQINMRGRLGPDRVARCGLTAYEDLWDPTINLACARVLYLYAGWQPWGFAPE